MEDLEFKIMTTTPKICKRRQGKKYIDDVIFIIRKEQEQQLQDHINMTDTTVVSNSLGKMTGVYHFWILDWLGMKMVLSNQ